MVVFEGKGSGITEPIVQSLSRGWQVLTGESQRSQPLEFGLVEGVAEDAFALEKASEVGRNANSVNEFCGHCLDDVILEQFGDCIQQFDPIRRELHLGGAFLGSRRWLPVDRADRIPEFAVPLVPGLRVLRVPAARAPTTVDVEHGSRDETRRRGR